MMMPDIQYPYAKLGDKMVSIDNAVRGGDYVCLGCGHPMIPKLGHCVRHHFAHKYRGECNPDLALHYCTIAHIMALFQEGQTITIRCPTCRNHREMLMPGDSIHAECPVLPPSRSDIVVFDGSMPQLIVEVVVTSEIKPPTRKRYRKSGLAVLVVRPWWTPASIAFNAQYELNAPPCRSCIRLERLKRQRLRRTEDEEMVARLAQLARVLSYWSHRLDKEVIKEAEEQKANEYYRRRNCMKVDLTRAMTKTELTFNPILTRLRRRVEMRAKARLEAERRARKLWTDVRLCFSKWDSESNEWAKEQTRQQIERDARALAAISGHSLSASEQADKAHNEFLEWKLEWDAAHAKSATDTSA